VIYCSASNAVTRRRYFRMDRCQRTALDRTRRRWSTTDSHWYGMALV